MTELEALRLRVKELEAFVTQVSHTETFLSPAARLLMGNTLPKEIWDNQHKYRLYIMTLSILLLAFVIFYGPITGKESWKTVPESLLLAGAAFFFSFWLSRRTKRKPISFSATTINPKGPSNLH